ncbi:MAG: hypothetical protein JO259_11050, partial [Mycobacterium sp.]|nr:hypothetical protein [Mycobacterium sp.]
MKKAHRVGVLAVGLGIGAGAGATAGVASAEPFSPPDPAAGATADISSAAAAEAADAAFRGMNPFGFDLAISIDGVNIIEGGSAYATSDSDDFAIAIGAG